MNGSNRLPTVFILRQAMDVIRREALKFEIETGGILIGSRSQDGDILVTHATPPGPAAVHNAVYFKRDVAYQQAALNSLHRRYGVQYIGEWHKHPRNLPVPSRGDMQGVYDLLADPDYGVNDLLFPIVICEPDIGFQIHPFYVSNSSIESAFQPMKWHEFPLSVDADQVFELLRMRVQPRENSTPSVTQPSSQKVTRQGPASQAKSLSIWSMVERCVPYFSRPPVSESVEHNEHTIENEKVVHPVEAKPPQQWYETATGRQRLAHEQKLLKSFGLVSKPFTIDDGRLCFSFPRGGGREIVVICGVSHPVAPPRFMIRARSGDKHLPIDSPPWDPDKDFIADAVVPMLGPLLATPELHE